MAKFWWSVCNHLILRTRTEGNKGNTIYFWTSQKRRLYGPENREDVDSRWYGEAFTVLPGYYDLDFSVRVGAGGKALATIGSVEFISAVNFEEKQAIK